MSRRACAAFTAVFGLLLGCAAEPEPQHGATTTAVGQPTPGDDQPSDTDGGSWPDDFVGHHDAIETLGNAPFDLCVAHSATERAPAEWLDALGPEPWARAVLQLDGIDVVNHTVGTPELESGGPFREVIVEAYGACLESENDVAAAIEALGPRLPSLGTGAEAPVIEASPGATTEPRAHTPTSANPEESQEDTVKPVVGSTCESLASSVGAFEGAIGPGTASVCAEGWAVWSYPYSSNDIALRVMRTDDDGWVVAGDLIWTADFDVGDTDTLYYNEASARRAELLNIGLPDRLLDDVIPAPAPPPTTIPERAVSGGCGSSSTLDCEYFYEEYAPSGALTLTTARMGPQPGHDRFVLEFEGDRPARLVVSYSTTRPYSGETTEPIELGGDVFVTVWMNGARAFTDQPYTGPTSLSGATENIVEATMFYEFEGDLGWVIGLDAPTPDIDIVWLDSPTRLVLNVWHPGG